MWPEMVAAVFLSCWPENQGGFNRTSPLGGRRRPTLQWLSRWPIISLACFASAGTIEDLAESRFSESLANGPEVVV